MGAAGLSALALIGNRTHSGVAQSTPTQATASSDIAVYPPHGTLTASPGTEITFRGVVADALGSVTVVGSLSGGHSGVFMPHADGEGVSFVPDAPFQAGEWVTVRAAPSLRPTPSGSITFKVAIPGTPDKTPVGRESAQPATPPREFRSRLDLLPPTMTVTTPAVGTAPGYVFVGAKIEDGQTGAMILDDRGDLIWFAPLDVDVAAHNDVRVQEYHGEPVITMWEGIAKQGTGFGHFVLRNGAYESIATIRAGNGYPGGDQHECLLTPQGAALVIIYNPVVWDLSPVGGDANGTALDGVIQEIDVATGRVLFEWHSLDHVALDESYSEPPSDTIVPWDYFHLNSVELDDDGNLIISARHTNAIYKIERRTGRILWRLNGKHSDFMMGPQTSFAYQHDARIHPNGELTLFDNAEADQDAADHARSRGVVLTLDEDAKTATLVREYIHPTEVLAVSQGNLHMLPNGNVFIGWGSAPVFSEFDADGNLVFNGRFPKGGTSYRAYRLPWIGKPDEPPAVAVETGLGSEVTVYASWNGATEVANWQVLAGPDPDRMQPVGTSVRTGFETPITVETAEPYVAAQALDAEGNMLGVSEAIMPGA